MAGITSFGAYIPFNRMGKETVGWGKRGEKAVANFDEDSITMAVASVVDCLHGIDRNTIDGLYFATTTAPYLEKQGAALIAEAGDLNSNISTADFANSLRSGTLALRSALDAIKADTARNMMVTAADLRIPKPRSEFESKFGDGAAAFILGNEGVIAEVEDSYSIAHEILDSWRTAGETYVQSSEDRFAAEEGFFNILPKAVNCLLEKCQLKPSDFNKAVFYAPDARKHKQMAAILGFDAKNQVQDPLFDLVGNTGSAHAMMILAAALEEANPGDRILFANYGDGADVFVLKITEEINKLEKRRGIQGHLNPKTILPDYLVYARWRSLIDIAPPVRRPPLDPPSPAALYRERNQNIRLHGSKCNSCGYNQYPIQRVCTKCTTKDNFTTIRFSDRKATLFTYSLDYLGPTQDPPLAICFINFEDGGRMQSMMTDRVLDQVKIGAPLEMSFRKLHTVGGIHNYFWKCIPIRE